MKQHMRMVAIVMLGALATSAAAAREAAVPPQAAEPMPATMITRLIIDYTPTATKQTSDDPRFSNSQLRRAVADGLAARGLLDQTKAQVVHVAAIEIDEFDISATSNIVLMGRVASLGVLGATVRIRDGSSKELQQFHVRAEVALRISPKSEDMAPPGKLYKAFTSQIADALTGKVRSPPPPR